MASALALASLLGADGHAVRSRDPAVGWEWVLLGAPGLGLLVGGWPGAQLGAQVCWVAVPVAGPGLLHPASRGRGAESAWLGRGLQTVA